MHLKRAFGQRDCLIDEVALCGSLITPESLPDLRADHRALVGPADLLNVEAARLTNSLNILSEEVLRWVNLVRK